MKDEYGYKPSVSSSGRRSSNTSGSVANVLKSGSYNSR